MEAKLGPCINHAGVEAVIRCKYCGQAVCGRCMVSAPLGNFCSPECVERFSERAGRLKTTQRSASTASKLAFKRVLMRLLGKFVALVLLLTLIGAVSIQFQVPVLADLAWKVVKLSPFSFEH